MADPTVDWETCADSDCAGVRLPTGQNPLNSKVNANLMADLMLKGKAGGYPADIATRPTSSANSSTR